MKKVKKLGILLVTLMVLEDLGFSISIGRQASEGFSNVTPREGTLRYAKDYEKVFDQSVQDKDLEELAIPSRQKDHTVPVILLKKPGNKNMAVLVHGLGGTKTSLARIMDIFLDLGYNVLAIDQRNPGDNQAPHNTLGALEPLDTLDTVQVAENKLDNGGKLVLWGESYGGVSAAIAARRGDSKIDVLILESPLAGSNDMLDRELEKIEKNQGIPLAYMRWTGDLYIRYKLYSSSKGINACQWIHQVTIPAFISNPDQDQVTPPYIGEDLYQTIPHDKRRLYTVQGFGHTEFPQKERETYQRLVEDFLQANL